MKEEFKDRLKRALEIRGVKTYAIGRDTAVSRQSVDNYCAGRKPQYDKAIIIAEYLNINLNWLMTGEGKMDLDEVTGNEKIDKFVHICPVGYHHPF